MSREYGSQDAALLMGMFYSGRSDLYHQGEERDKAIEEILEKGKVKEIDESVAQFGHELDGCRGLEFKNKDGVMVKIVSCKFRDGYDLWLVDPVSGMAMRT